MKQNRFEKILNEQRTQARNATKRSSAWGAAADTLDRLETQWILETYAELAKKSNKSA